MKKIFLYIVALVVSMASLVTLLTFIGQQNELLGTITATAMPIVILLGFITAFAFVASQVVQLAKSR